MRRLSGGCAHILGPLPAPCDPADPTAAPLAAYRRLARRGAPLPIEALQDLQRDAAALVRLYAPSLHRADHTARDSTPARVWASVVDGTRQALRTIWETGDRALARERLRRVVVGIALEEDGP